MPVLDHPQIQIVPIPVVIRWRGLFAPRMPRLGTRSFSGCLRFFAVNTLGRGKGRVLLIMVDLSGKLHEFRFPVRAAKAIMQFH